ncbi:MAG: hypothetical protein QXD94_02740 [Sulfolobales archaeon]
MLHYLKLGYGRVNFLLSKVISKIESINSKIDYSESPEVKKSLVKELEGLQILARSLARMSAILEVLITRVETLTLLNLTIKDLAVIKNVVQELKKYSFNIPELSIIIEDIDDKVNDLIHETRGSFNESSVGVVVTEDVRKVISEAELIANSKLKDLEKYSNPIKI